MTELREILVKRGIRKAVVIDDMFDAVPQPDDLNVEDWSVFFDDIGEEGRDLLTGLYPGYDSVRSDELINSQQFVSLVWENRQRLRGCSQLFGDYETTKASELHMLDTLVKELRNLGLACTTMGRVPDEQARNADLIIVDLFLGYKQSGEDINRAVCRVKEFIDDRVGEPPLIVLYSRSPRLKDMRDDFRDKAGLLGSMFRVATKAELADSRMLHRLLSRLALHYEDAKRVARFVHAWNIGLDRAQKDFIKVLRRLDLPDLAQIRALLLDFEGQLLGEYLLDVADRVLQHEIESDDNTIAAALELNKIDLEHYPAPHLTGSPDLQDLVYRMVFSHSQRHRLSDENGKLHLQFGDLLRWKAEDGAAFCDDVSLVVTPACDLMRNGVKRVLLLSGKLESLEPKNWSYKAQPVRTPIVILPNEERKWIKWNLKDVRTLTLDELDKWLNKTKRLIRIGRLREVNAIEIQQLMLAHLGRIGRPANLPVPFPVEIAFFYVGTDSKANRLETEQIETAACYVGRDKASRPIHRLVLTEEGCDRIERALHNIEPEKFHVLAQPSLAAVKSDSGFFASFERGEIQIPLEPGGKKQKKAGSEIQAVIVRGDDFEEGKSVTGDDRKAALIVKVTDVEQN
ncbi:MAG: hypothetical protein OYM47_15000 [Gemmatimonadota bacterium]|nr:hypothetical protein [Gemmatimonadota bacterium]